MCWFRVDGQGNTALHYATQRWDQDTVRRLLERGANIGIKNKLVIITNIPHRILRKIALNYLNTN